jgi:four helix bundle protein
MAFRFQSWQVYKDARALRKEINQILKTFPPEERYVLIDQMKRAMLSVMLQIAEGSERKTEKDKNLFINRSLTSLFEIVSCLDCSFDDKYINEKQYNDLTLKAENIAKQLRGFEKYIRKSY